MEKIARKIAEERKKATQFTAASAVAAINKRFAGEGQKEGEEDTAIRSVSRDANRIDEDSEEETEGEEQEEEDSFFRKRTLSDTYP